MSDPGTLSRPTITRPILSRDQVAENLAIPAQVLIRYETRGLIHATREGEVEGYAPTEIRRIWSILTFQRDLGINLAGIEVILQLRDHLAEVHHRLDALAGELDALLLEDDAEDDA